MPRNQVAYVAACLAVLGGSLCYLLCDFGAWPKLAYQPYLGTWIVTRKPLSATTMMYPGMLLWGLSGALVSAAAGLLIAGRWRGALSARAVTLLGAWAASSVAFVALYFLWGLWPF